mmetsp:Transcript_79991/g.208620  ORF Transcript_79991/g.208620 Transcript_79991/m.208620 type:complete len:207 (-) Transcript_79991:1824-2444(-)
MLANPFCKLKNIRITKVSCTAPSPMLDSRIKCTADACQHHALALCSQPHRAFRAGAIAARSRRHGSPSLASRPGGPRRGRHVAFLARVRRQHRRHPALLYQLRVPAEDLRVVPGALCVDPVLQRPLRRVEAVEVPREGPRGVDLRHGVAETREVLVSHRVSRRHAAIGVEGQQLAHEVQAELAGAWHPLFERLRGALWEFEGRDEA